MKILIVNLHSAHNAGDHVLLQVGLQELYRQFPACEITLAMNDPTSYAGHADAGDERVVDSFFAWFKSAPASGAARPKWQTRLMLLASLALSLWIALAQRLLHVKWLGLLPSRYRASVAAYLDADMVVSCAGNFLYSRAHSYGLPLLGQVFAIFYGWLAGKPLYMLPQTVGPLWRRWERWLIRWLLLRMRVVLLRDITSVELLARMNIPAEKYHLTPDLAFLYAAPARPTGHDLLLRYGIKPDEQRPLLGVTLINWGLQHPRFTGQARYEAAVATAIQQFISDQQGWVILFSQVCGPTPADDDRTPAQRVHALLTEAPLAERVILIDEALPAATLRSAYGCMDLFLGSRLHSNIFALTEATPVVAIAYQDKTWGVMRMLELAAWVIAIEDVAAGPLIARMQAAWTQRAAVRQQIEQRLPPIQAEAREAVALLRADFCREQR